MIPHTPPRCPAVHPDDRHLTWAAEEVNARKGIDVMKNRVAASMGSNPEPLAASGVIEGALTQAAPSRFHRRRVEGSHESRVARPAAATLLIVAGLRPRPDSVPT